MTRSPAAWPFALAAASLAICAILLAVFAVRDRDWLRGSGAIVLAGLGVGMADEAVALWWDRPTISWVVFRTFQGHEVLWVILFLTTMLLVGALARHFSGGGARWGILVAGGFVYLLGGFLAERWIPTAP